MMIDPHVGDIAWFWHDVNNEPESGLMVQTGSRVSVIFFEGKALQISNNRVFSSMEDCLRYSLRHEFSRWR